MAIQYTTRLPDYTDLDLDFLMSPTTHDVQRKVGDEAIKRSVRNLIFTNFYDRPFRSYIGSGVRALLFENANEFTANRLQAAIIEVINKFEPRVAVINVVVTPDYDRNGFEVRLEYVILNREQPIITTIFLERVR